MAVIFENVDKIITSDGTEHDLDNMPLGADALSEMTNASITSPQDGDSLIWDAIAEAWVPSSEISILDGEAVFTTPGTYTWTCPADVPLVSAVCVGGGCNGGGGLGWKNNIPVVPGTDYTVVVGEGHSGYPHTNNSNYYQIEHYYRKSHRGEDSYFISDTIVCGRGSVFSSGGGWVGDGGGSGGSGGFNMGFVKPHGSGGGAGGYTGNGGSGSWRDRMIVQNYGSNSGTGGGGAGGSWIDNYSFRSDQHGQSYSLTAFCGGGGVGLYGEGASGQGGQGPIGGGQGGSGGGGGSSSQTGRSGTGGGCLTSDSGPSGNGWAYYSPAGNGAVRIMWGTGRSFPNNAA